MVKSFDDVMNQFSEEEQQEINRRADLIRTELALREIRWSTGTSQQSVARKLKVNQSTVSKLESRQDMNIRTLEEYVKALGGELELYVKLPNKKKFKIKRAESREHPAKPTGVRNGSRKSASVKTTPHAARRNKG